MERRIKNLNDLCAMVGAGHDTIESVSRRIYKDTACGASVDGFEPGLEEAGKKRVFVRVTGSMSILGFMVWSIHVTGKPVFDIGRYSYRQDGTMPRTPEVDKPVPAAILAFLGAKREHRTYRTGLEEQEAIRKACGNHGQPNDADKGECSVRYSLARGGVYTIKFWISVPKLRKHRGGVTIHSIVEGVDRETEVYTLYYPFTEKQWDEAVAAVEAEAEAIWNDTHGGDACPENDEGGHSIDPECPVCHGEGQIL